MPVTIDDGDIIAVRLEYSDEGELGDVALNILHYQVVDIAVSSSGLPSAVAIPWEDFGTALAETAYDLFATQWSLFASEDVVMVGCTVQKIAPGTRSSPISYTPEAPTSGTIVGDSLPMQDAVTILKRTGYGERWGQGRVFVPGIPESRQSQGRLEPAGVASLNGLINQLKAQVLVTDGTYDTTMRPVLFSDTVDPPRIHPITSTGLSNNVIKTQRRRRPGKGS